MADDELVADADVTWTRAITTDAPPARVWPDPVAALADRDQAIGRK